MTHWTFEPLQLAPILLLAVLYAKRVRTLRTRAHAPPAWRIALYGLGIALLFIAVASPLDFYGEESSQALHMSQHILLGDLAPLALLAGLTGPVLRPLLALVHPLRRRGKVELLQGLRQERHAKALPKRRNPPKDPARWSSG